MRQRQLHLLFVVVVSQEIGVDGLPGINAPPATWFE